MIYYSLSGDLMYVNRLVATNVPYVITGQIYNFYCHECTNDMYFSHQCPNIDFLFVC